MKSLSIQSLELGHAYQLRVSAGNLYGYGTPSHPVDVALDEEKIKSRSRSDEDAPIRGKKVKVDDYDKFCKYIIICTPIIAPSCHTFGFVSLGRHAFY